MGARIAVPQPITSRLSRMRKKRVTRGGKVWHYRCGTYMPVTDHLRALFGNPEDAKLMSWHASADRKKDDGMLWHPSDGQRWKDFDKAYPEFGKEPRTFGSR